MSKTIRFLVLSSILVLSAFFVTGANAQLCTGFNLSSDDCAFITQATENTKAAGAVSFTYENETAMVTGFFDSNDVIEGATGVFVFDADGVITSAQIDIENISSVTSFSEGTNALSFILVDGIAYIGVGETLDTVVWEQFPAEFTENMNFNITNLTTIGNDEATGALSGIETNWTRNESGNETVFSTNIADVDPFALADAEELAILGDTTMSGNMNASLTLAVNNTTNTISTIATSMHMTYTIGSVDAGAIMGEDQEGMTEEESAVMGDMLSGLFGEGNEQSVASSYVLSLSVEDVDTAISAPEGATAISDEMVETLGYVYANEPFSFIREFYTEYTFLTGFSFNFGDESSFNWDFDFDTTYYYSGMCSESVRTPAEQGSIAVGESVTSTLTAGNSDIWTFDANEGDVITLTMASSALDSYIELIAPDGTGLASDDDGGSYPDSAINGFTLEQSGTYQVVACSYYSDSEGEYTIALSN
jgi:hypothetical protein